VATTAQDAACAVKHQAENAASAVSSTAKDAVHYVQEKGVSGMTEDVSSLIRRYPIMALGIAIGLGFMLSSLVRRD
jgi:ElaB/YqjD/DUF883 family membrane-anchored ribosome-binding protein